MGKIDPGHETGYQKEYGLLTKERSVSYNQNGEPLFDNFLRDLRHNKIIKHIPDNAQVLDLGCGYDGTFLKRIENKIIKGVGVDISIDPRAHTERIILMQLDLNNDLPLPDEHFDVVTSLANLEHITATRNIMQNIYRVLRPGGVLLLTAPSTYAKPVLEFLASLRIVSRQEIRDHKHYFNKKLLSDLCREIGFSSIDHRYFQLGMNNFLIARK
jgi:SAM-dependent methyltransferase